MLTGLVDHLWQSCCCSGLLCAFSRMARGNAALVRLWLLRIAAAKLLLPFSLLVALGAWFGYPTPHTSDPTPPWLSAVFCAARPFAGPAQYLGLAGVALAAISGIALATAVASGWWIVRRIRVARAAANEEQRRTARNPTAILPSLGFSKAVLLTTFAAVVVFVPLLAGAVADHARRRELLIANAVALRDAPAVLRPAKRGMGQRVRVDAEAHGVSIRNANINDLVAIAYGVNPYTVISPQFISEPGQAEVSWLVWPRYDVRIDGAVPAPVDFDTYALRQTLTRLLADQFGLEIYVNGDCQPPCGIYQLALADDPL